MQGGECLWLLDALVAGTGFTGIVLSLGIVASRHKTPRNCYRAALFFFFSLSQIVGFFNYSQEFRAAPLFPYVQNPLELVVAGLFFRYFRSIFDPQAKFWSWSLCFFLPAVVTAAAYTPFFFHDLPFRQAHYPDVRLLDLPGGVVLYWLNRLTEVWCLVCLLSIFVRFRVFQAPAHLVRPARRTFLRQRRGLAVYILTWVGVLVLILFNNFRPSDLARNLISLSLTFQALVLFFLVERYQEFFQGIQIQFESHKYQRSRFTGTNFASLETKLEHLMKSQRLFADADVNLESVARRLGLSGPQLSEFVNNHLGVSFSSYINDLRADEALRLLDEDRDSTVLDVGLACGFGSKSAFNRVFKEYMGMTPTAYRNRPMGPRRPLPVVRTRTPGATGAPKGGSDLWQS